MLVAAVMIVGTIMVANVVAETAVKVTGAAVAIRVFEIIAAMTVI